MVQTSYNPQKIALKPIAYWLLFMAAMVFLMAIIGAATRLTESGLSIVEWEPIKGAIPPLNIADWQAEFSHYQGSPQFKEINANMSLEEFKGIFWWEWAHRLLGRLIGVFFLFPMLYFMFTRKIPTKLKYSLIGLFCLGGAQGLMGWIMVASGLVDVPEVSHFRLAAHLGLAALLFGLLILTALNILRPSRLLYNNPKERQKLRFLTSIALIWAAITLIYGAFTAGLDAGLIYNTYPLMDGNLLPESFGSEPLYNLAINDRGMVQFIHRWLATGLVLYIISIYTFYYKRMTLPHIPSGLLILAAFTALIQLCLGLSTLLLQVPINIAVTHQATAFTLIGILIWLRYEVRG